MSPHRSPIAAGALLALLAAVSFGLTTPVIERAGRGLGPFSTAALLYAGAALSALVLGRLAPSSGAPWRPIHLVRLCGMALAGAALAPSLLAWGLQRSGAATGSLLLNLEALFTVLLAWLIYREQIGRRVAVALGFMALGGAALTFNAASTAGFQLVGALAIASATAAWALDNTLSRGLAEQDPVQIVACKGALGAAVTAALALASGESRPTAFAVWALLACGATGYGLSLRLYLLAQRRIGAARTASIFAIAPFVGAALAWLTGDRSLGVWTLVSAAFFGLGVLLHMTERHRHAHIHSATEHDHPHRHDDGHHDHVHQPNFIGEHSHPHHHDRLEHDHEHAPDVHHEHTHS